MKLAVLLLIGLLETQADDFKNHVWLNQKVPSPEERAILNPLQSDKAADNHVWVSQKLPPPPPSKASKALPQRSNFLQKLDNFNPVNTQVYNMRYYYNYDFWKPGGPVFIMLGGESGIEPGWLQGGQLFDMAVQNNAAMFEIEHRYYGESRPTYSLSTENLKYLSAPQALADYEKFIQAVKRIDSFNSSKVVVFGCSYPGNLALWMREQYPNLVHAAVSSSAPLEAKVDFKEYFEVIQQALKDPNCYGVITNAIQQIQKYFASGRNEIAKVKTDFNLCQEVNVTNFYDKSYFYSYIASTFAGIVQYAMGNTIQSTCNELMNSSLPNDYVRLSAFIKKRRKDCAGNYPNFVQYYSNIYLTGDSRQWLYQTCNEFGYFQTSDGANQPFGNNFPVELNYRMCNDVFKNGFGADRANVGATTTNNRYGAKNPKVTRVVTTHGGGDPWHPLGLSRDLNADAPVTIVPGASHCNDVYSLSNSDSPEMKNAKLKQQQYIKKWLSLP